ncbi:substrate-binding domain-containing protein [Streptomyces sp. NL15-2K]|uniref:substrate-binding domain-containing protein n=1 Tax=Streptomyces sp. NL15-2K TaxID=376149 RepID=UPI000F573131|nr:MULTISPECIES: substrate-binding domain-containing protein [Actinomycetes]WKX11132.1 substrate-binding domain-containing protein [Kutzneria buriramensis]GCB52077.1 phosphate ABC transporter [Streptomyces sp. NL15-2K]
MEWLNAENLVAVGTAVLGLAASVAVVWYERRVPRRKRIGFRVQMDTPIGSDARNGGRPNVRFGLFDEFSDLSDATLVLLRIENDGSVGIAGEDYTSRERHGLTAVFADRTIRGIAVTQPLDAVHLMEHFTPVAGLRHDGGTLYLPKVPLNKGQHFKVLALLTGGGVGCDVRVIGGIRDGEVKPNRGMTADDKPPLFSRPARLITVLFTACVITLASIIVIRNDDVPPPPPIGCAKGTLTVTGSTAFAPAAEKLGESYEKACPGSDIKVEPHGSTAGIRALDTAGAEAASSGGSPSVIAFSDGRKPNGYPELRENPVAVSVFTLVVNDRVTVRDLSLDEVRKIYRGEIRNWQDVDGPNMPILLVSRDANSGTREVFQRQVLESNEPANSSRDCRTKDDTNATVIRCELDSTAQVLSTVARLSGAIGYSEPRSAAATKGRHSLSIDGQTASIETLGTSDYPYREIEYAYTYGRPPADSLSVSFINYVTRGAGQDVVRDQGHFPCLSPEGLRLCGGR